MKIILTGGGTGGSVSPLLAVAAEILKLEPKAQFLFIGTRHGPEKLMAAQQHIPYAAISPAKWRRYLSLKNLASPFLLVAGFFQALKILKKYEPNCVFGSGSFVQVPVMWAAWFLKVPCVIHQQDLHAGLANRLCQIPARKITVTFAESLKDFASGWGLFEKKLENKTVLTGNPFRESLKNYARNEALDFFKLEKDFPTLLVLGGGTGANFLNQLISKSLPELTKTVQIIHSTGRGKQLFSNLESSKYRPMEFIDNMAAAYAAADLVLSRAGLSTITELSNLGKVSIIVPMPGTHQEFNALYLYRHQAAFVLPQDVLSPELLTNVIRKMLFGHDLQESFKKQIQKIMPRNSAKKIAEIIIKLSLEKHAFGK